MGYSWEGWPKKIKKIQKKFCDKAVWGVLAYPTGGGAFGMAAKRNFHNRNGGNGNDKRHTHSQTTKIVRITYFPNFVTFPKIGISKM